MSGVVGSVTAELVLDTQGFNKGIQTAMETVKQLDGSFKTMGSSVSSKQFDALLVSLEKSNSSINDIKKSVQELSTEYKKVEQTSKEAFSVKQGENWYSELQKYKEKIREVNLEYQKLVERQMRIDEGSKAFSSIVEDAQKAINVLKELGTQGQEPFEKLTAEARKATEAVNNFHEHMRGKSTETNLNPIIEQAQKANAVLKELGNSGRSTFEKITEEAHKARGALQKFQEANSGKSLESNLKPVIDTAQKAVREFEKLREESLRLNEVNAFQKIIENAGKAVTGLEKVHQESARVRAELNSLNNSAPLSNFNNALLTGGQRLGSFALNATNSTNSLSSFSNTTASAGTKVGNLNSTVGKGVTNVQTLGTTYNTTSGTISKFGSSTQNANSKLKQHWSQIYQLTSALHSLKVVLSTVSSMFIWTFGMSLWEATKQTISSKNEMTSYLEQMGKGVGEIRSFNEGLDETVARFQKLNKFMIGETIAGIGAEFDLSIDEMKKSMEVVAMIQNEYVRAGRKESEASLAVKDILQGEFLRLSRETGVGKQDLIDTGKWSGDLKDVMGLMEALKEVGESRHWDLFASKCRSLNDVISATKNRISEFTATLIDELSPAIVTSFNAVMDIVDGATEAFNNMGVFEKVLIGVGAFFALSTATMMLAGNISLLDITMYGYVNSLWATILQTDVATVKEYGVLKAIMAKITGVKAEQVAEMGVAKAIATKLLGLDAEIVKEHGLKSAIAVAVASRNADTVATEANTAVNTIHNTTMEISSALYTVNTAETEANTTAKVVNEGANLGVFRTLVMMVTGMEAETVASMSATSALWAFITATTVLEAVTIAGVLIGIAVAFGTVAKSIQDTCAKMKEYNDLIANGDETIQALKDAYKGMQDEQNALTEQYYNGTLSADEYNAKLEELGLTTRDLEQASKDLDVAIENIDYAGKFAKTIDNRKIVTATKTNRELSDAMKSQGYDDDQIKSVEHYQQLVAFGNAQLYRGLQVYNKQNSDFIENEKQLNDSLAKNNVDIKDREQWVRDLGEAYADLEEQSWIANTSDDWWEVAWAKMGAGLAQMKIDWINFWSGMDLAEFLKFDFSETFKKLGLDGISNSIREAFESIDWSWIVEPLTNFDKMFSEWSANAQKTINDWVNNFGNIIEEGKLGEEIMKFFKLDNINFDDIFKPIREGIGKAIDEFMADPFGLNSHEGMGGAKSKGAKHIDGNNFLNNMFKDMLPSSDEVATFVNEKIVTPFTDAINNFVQNPLGAVVGGVLDIGQFLANIFGISEEFSAFTTFVQEKIAIPLQNEINLFIADPFGYMGGMMESFNLGNLLNGLFGVGDEGTSAFITEFVNNSIITPFATALTYGLASIPIVGDILTMLGLIDTTTGTASQKGWNIGSAIGSAIENFIRNIPIVGDILAMLGLIDGTTGTAHGKGDAVGSNIKQGVDDGKRGTADLVRSEMSEVISSLASAVGEAYSTAQAIGGAIMDGINSMIQHHSPGLPAQLISAEMGEIVLAMANARDTVFFTAQSIGQAINDGIQPNGEINFDAEAMAQYQANTMMAMGMADETVVTTETAFTDLDYNTMTTFASISNTIGTTMTNIANNTKLNYTTIANTTKTQLTNMQSQTTKNIGAIKQSWAGMQTALIQSAEHIRSETGAKIQSLQNNMATFWRKVQNPALLLGAGTPSEERAVKPRRYGSRGASVRKVLTPKGNRSAGSPNPRGRSSMPHYASPLKLAPNSRLQGKSFISADDADNILSGWKDWKYDSNTRFKVIFEYLKCLFEGGDCVAGKGHYAGGWDFDWTDEIKQAMLTWHTHFGEIYDPYLYVGKFENDDFPIRGIAPIAKNYIYDAISRTSYEFYWDGKYGDPLSIWNAGHFNCWDGAILVMALARALGFPNSHMVHGTWGGLGHVWAYVEGLGNIDATAIQNGYGLTAPSRTGVAGAMPRFKHNKAPTSDDSGSGDIHIHIDMSGATVTDDSIGERIGRKVRDEIIDLINPSTSTGY